MTKEFIENLLHNLIRYHEEEIKRHEDILVTLREDLTKLQFKKENKDV